MSKEFTVTFWVRIKSNPKWNETKSEINFPPVFTNDRALIFFSKYGELLKVYILHPELGYKKIVTNIEKYLRMDTFLALTNSPKESKLYLNGKLVETIKANKKKIVPEAGDYVMVKIKSGDSKSLTIGDNVEVIVPAKIIEVRSKSLELQLFNPSEKLILSEDRIKH